MHKISITLGLLVFGLFVANAQMSERELVDSIQEIMKERHIPGMFISITKTDSVLWSRGFGFANWEGQVPVDNQLFQIGSVTKSFTAIAIMKLVSQGILNLNDPLSSIAPEVPFTNRWEKTNPVLLHHLLEHKAGFDDMHFAAMAKDNNERMDALQEVMKHKNALKSRWQPGLVHSYSNPGYVILGYLIEKYSGVPYQEYIRNEILIPLRMNNTYFMSQTNTKAIEERKAQGYEWYDDRFGIARQLYIVGEAAGSLHSNKEDMIRFVKFYLNKGKLDSAIVLPESAFEELESIHGEFEREHHINVGYSPGLYVRFYGNKNKTMFRGHSGGILGFGSDYIYNRDLDLGIVVSNNGETGNRQVLNLLVDYFVSENVALPQHRSLTERDNEWEGLYLMNNSRNQILRFADRLAATIRIELKGDTVLLRPFMSDVEKYLAISDRAFRKVDEPAASLFFMDKEGEQIIQFQMDQFQRTQPVTHFALLGFVLVSILLGLIAILWLVVALIRYFFRRKKGERLLQMLIYAAPYMVFLALLLIFLNMMSLHNLLLLGKLNARTFTIFVLSLLLPVLSLLSTVLWIRKRKNPGVSPAIKYFCLLFSIGSIILSVYMGSMGWIGVAFWSY